ncbi:amidohydrolase family protein [Roseisolibacter agri]|uniref:Amidohydrolase n=1 Tax=Roseisolibacter agri TaxID=2014610 RepID=A0AA37Q9P3_9BACT|nr:amidohydrolase family protein [Roseisolibacter agri]GLC27307.1 amidohydrolase [Roseisolibacter agri]
MRRLITALAATAVLGAPLAAQTIAITGGTVYPVSGPKLENATVLMRDGRIVAVGTNVTIPAGAQRIDATGKWVTPGLVNAYTQLGVVEVGAVTETRDVSARGRDAISAAFTVWDGLNPASVLLAPARNEGVTTVGVIPGSGLIAGQAAIVDLVDGTATDMVRRAPVAMVATMTPPGGQGNVPASRGELQVRLREILSDVRAYMRNRAAYERAESRELAVSRADLEALIPVVQGRLPMLVQADRASDIDAALRLSREFGFKLIVGGGAEAWQVADRLKAANVPVLTGAMSNLPSSFTTLGARQESVGLLRRAGVSVAIIGNGGGDEETFNARNIRYEAGNAVAYGATWDDALRAITLAPAEVFGVADRIGSLAVGKDANVVVWSGDPFEFRTDAEHVFIRGRSVKAPSRQDQLMERYKTLPPTYRTP